MYRNYIEGYIMSGLSTAVSEVLNNKIKVLKRMGYGNSNSELFKLKILQRCGWHDLPTSIKRRVGCLKYKSVGQIYVNFMG
jgi:hypothetical protein